jgi:UDP-glucuronate decarboxylase
MDKKRILITGGGGFIALHLAARLAAEPGTDITLLENFARGRMDAEFEALTRNPNIRLVTADLCAPGAFESLGTGYDEVYHMAAVLGVENVLQRPAHVVRVNAGGTLALLEWFTAGGGRKLMFPSTSEVYAWTQQFHELPVPTPEDVPLALTDIANPRSSYAGSKIFGELATTHYCRAAGLPFVITRYHNVYGPRMGEEHVIPQLYQRAAHQRQNPLVVYSSMHIRAFCYVDDAVTATIASMRIPAAEGGTFNIGNDREAVTIADLAQRILAKSGVSAPIEPRPAANDPILKRCPDITRARNVLGYEPQFSLDEGLGRTIEWYSRWFGQKSHAG